ncbi:MAG: CoA transferase [Syntrophobacteria bacterium]
MEKNQKSIFKQVAKAAALNTTFEDLQIEQTPTYLQDPVRVADFVTGVVGAFGASVAELGEIRGLPRQTVSVDRRLSTMSVNSAMWQYMNGVVITGGEIAVPVNSFYETKDSKWFCFNGAYPHLRDGILNYFDSANSKAALSANVKQFESTQIEEYFEKSGFCCAPMYSREEWAQHPHGQFLKDTPIISMQKVGDAKIRVLPEAKHRPLEGVRVIDITHVVAGPWLTRQLADQGADVISIRNPGFPFLYPVIFEESFGKKNIFLDFNSDKGKARLVELIKDADILVWGYNYSGLDRLGLSVEKLKEINPNLILNVISGYGLLGPWAKRKGWEQLAQTCTGSVDLASEGRDEHHLIGALPNDYGTGYLGAIAAVSALRQRQEEGGFWVADVNLTRTSMMMLEQPPEKEDAVPVSLDDLEKYLIDQGSSFGATFTRLESAARLSETPSFSATGPSIMGTHHPYKTGWDKEVRDAKPVVPHKRSEIVKEGLEGVLLGFGHEDRG